MFLKCTACTFSEGVTTQCPTKAMMYKSGPQWSMYTDQQYPTEISAGTVPVGTKHVLWIA